MVNTDVVKGLMALRGTSIETLSNVSGLGVAGISKWLERKGSDPDDAVPFDLQLDILQALGVKNGFPRPDVVHYWTITEPGLFGGGGNEWALKAVLTAFGKAQACYLARETEPSFSFKNETFFALKFDRFMAILKVQGPAFKNVRFSPEIYPNLEWIPGNIGLLLEEFDYVNLGPGSISAKSLGKLIFQSLESARWEQLMLSAQEVGVTAEEVANVLGATIQAKRELAEAEKRKALEQSAQQGAPADFNFRGDGLFAGEQELVESGIFVTTKPR